MSADEMQAVSAVYSATSMSFKCAANAAHARVFHSLHSDRYKDAIFYRDLAVESDSQSPSVLLDL